MSRRALSERTSYLSSRERHDREASDSSNGAESDTPVILLALNDSRSLLDTLRNAGVPNPPLYPAVRLAHTIFHGAMHDDLLYYTVTDSQEYMMGKRLGPAATLIARSRPL